MEEAMEKDNGLFEKRKRGRREGGTSEKEMYGDGERRTDECGGRQEDVQGGRSVRLKIKVLVVSCIYSEVREVKFNEESIVLSDID